MERVKILLFLSCAAVVLTSVAGQCPRIITRASWGARSANTAILPVRPAPLAIIHHTAGAACSTQGKWDMILKCGIEILKLFSNSGLQSTNAKHSELAHRC